MKKVITMVAVAAVAAVATADIVSFKYNGGVLSDAGGAAYPQGAIVGGAVTMLVDLNPLVSGGSINIVDIPAPLLTADISVGPAFAGGRYSTLAVESDTDFSGGAPMAYLVFDPNGGGIQVGDVIGLAAAGDTLNALTPPIGAGDIQSFSPGDIQANVTVIPEPATLGLMGIAGLGMYLARRKVRR